MYSDRETHIYKKRERAFEEEANDRSRRRSPNSFKKKKLYINNTITALRTLKNETKNSQIKGKEMEFDVLRQLIGSREWH